MDWKNFCHLLMAAGAVGCLLKALAATGVEQAMWGVGVHVWIAAYLVCVVLRTPTGE
jgi:hypothetical protein